MEDLIDIRREVRRRLDLADGLGIVNGPDEPNWQARYLLLQVVSPFEHHGEQVQFLTAQPRYQGETIAMLVFVGCTAGISRVRPGSKLVPGQSFRTTDVEYIIIGSVRPVDAA